MKKAEKKGSRRDIILLMQMKQGCASEHRGIVRNKESFSGIVYI